MNTKEIIAAGVTGTTFMTLFSDAVSKLKGSNYNEAQILAELLNRVTPLSKPQAGAAGWAGHYGMGLAFATAYATYLKAAKTKPTVPNSIAFGVLSGLAGVFIWKATFKAHPNPPGVDLKNFYKQLVIAHVVFGATAALVLGKQDSNT
jgi:hypothetical protein